MDTSSVSPSNNNSNDDDVDSPSISPYSSQSSSAGGYSSNGDVFHPEAMNGSRNGHPFLGPLLQLQTVFERNALMAQALMMNSVFNTIGLNINRSHSLSSINQVIETCTQPNQLNKSQRDTSLTSTSASVNNLRNNSKKLHSESQSTKCIDSRESDSSNKSQGNSREVLVATGSVNDPLRCHLCSYVTTPDRAAEYRSHMDAHFEHCCPYCDYQSRTEGRLKRHVTDFHSKDPPNSWSGCRPRDSNGSDRDGSDPGIISDGSNDMTSPSASTSSTSVEKPRKHKCKTCNYVSMSKEDFWKHQRAHIKPEKMLSCQFCPFATEYKHHLEYHMRNHTGSKPFKCDRCNYECVNKSMLNSHLKSHSNIYQYRCADCSYATKYCHSLKLHLRKYTHKPATVLNLDGTPNPYPIIDVYGTRRGPRPKKTKPENDQHHDQDSQDTMTAGSRKTSPGPHSLLSPLHQLQSLANTQDDIKKCSAVSPLNLNFHSPSSLKLLSIADNRSPQTKAIDELSMQTEEAQPLDLSVKQCV